MITVKIKDVELTNLRIAVGIGIIFGIGIFAGYYLTVSGVLI
jgi:hypothetical protein